MKAEYKAAVDVRQTGTASYMVECKYFDAAVRRFAVCGINGRSTVNELSGADTRPFRGYVTHWANLPAQARALIRGMMPTEWWDELYKAIDWQIDANQLGIPFPVNVE